MTSDRPNILILYVDEMRADCMGTFAHPERHPDLHTPNLDRLTDEGVLFEQAYTCYPLCTPSRGAFMTGRYPHANGVCGNHSPIYTNTPQLGSTFRRAGYESCYIGKIHLGGTEIPGFVQEKHRCGFEEFVGFNHGHDYFHSIYYRDNDTTPLHEPGFQPDIQTDLALEFIGRHHKDPWIAMLSIGTPHTPCVTPKRYDHLFNPDALTLLPGTDENGACSQQPYRALTARQFVAAYYRQIINIDENVGRLLETLDESGIADNTIVLFTSDHGDLLGQHAHFGKTWMHYGATRVPLVLRWPRRLPAAGRIGSLVDCSVDTFPTLLEACGLQIPATMQGISYFPLALGTMAKTRDAVFYEIIEWRGREVQPYVPLRGIRTEQYVYAHAAPGVNHPYERGEASPNAPLFYDRTSDPYELVNLIDSPTYDAVRQELNNRLEHHMRATDDSWDISAGEWPPSPAPMNNHDALTRCKELVRRARPDQVLRQWSGYVDRSSDIVGVALP